MLTAWAFYTRGHLPSSGGWEQQTEWWLQVIETAAEVIAQERAKKDQEESPLSPGEGGG